MIPGVSLVNAPGTVDAGYRGELQVLLLNTDSSAEFRLAAGDRVAGIVLKQTTTTAADQLEATFDRLAEFLDVPR